MSERMSLADLLGKNVAVEWFEAVSLVREVCSVLLSERIESSTPELAQILLMSTGTLAITGTGHADVPVRRLGQLLQAMLLRTTDPPVTLRLVLSEAMAAPPVYGSIADLDAALAYFERPDRHAVLRALYERAASPGADTPETAAVQDLDSIAPLPQPKNAQKKKPRKPVNRRATALVALAALLLAVAAAAYQRGLLFAGDSLQAAGTRATGAVDKAVFATVSAVTELAGMGKLVAPGTELPPDAPAPPKQASATARRRSPRATPPITLAGIPVKIFDLQPAKEVDAAVGSPAAMPPLVLEASVDPARMADTKVYGPEDAEVEAPLAIRPHLPSTLPPGVSASQLARIELVVAPDGLVDEVKLLPGTSPVTVTEAMLLSAAKAWRFSPAIKDGRPVRYRKTVFLSDK